MAHADYNAKTIKLIRDAGFFIGRVEHYDSFSRKRHDLFGIIDYVAMGQGSIIGVQSTSYSGKSAHKAAIEDSRTVRMWLKCGGKFLFVAWKKKPIPKGKKALAAEAEGQEVKERYSYEPEVFMAVLAEGDFVRLEAVAASELRERLSVS